MISLDNLKTVINAIKCLLTDYPKKKDIPTKLPNPNPLTFTGASTAIYDGSEALTMNIPEQVQSDWNQNDNTQPDYVKNRTHYSKIARGTIVEEQSVTINYNETDERYVELDAKQNIVEGNTYTVILNGVSYECVAWKEPGSAALVLGNGSFNYNEGLGEDVPFACLFSEDEFGYLYAELYAADGDYTISVEGDIEKVRTLDEKYLPKSVPLQKDMCTRGLQMVFNLENSGIMISDFVGNDEITSNISLTTWREFANTLKKSLVYYTDAFYFSVYETGLDEEDLPISFSLVGYDFESVNNVPTVKYANLNIVYNKKEKTVTCRKIK